MDRLVLIEPHLLCPCRWEFVNRCRVIIRCSTRIGTGTYPVYGIRCTDRKADREFGVAYHKYADDTQLYTAPTAKLDICINLLELCSSALQQWFGENDLLLNPDKSKVCFFGTRQKLRHAIRPSSIRVAGCGVDVCEKLKTLGVSLDSALSLEDHINGIIRSCNYHIRAVHHIRRH